MNEHKREPFGIRGEAFPAWLSLTHALERIADATITARRDAAEACGHCPVMPTGSDTAYGPGSTEAPDQGRRGSMSARFLEDDSGLRTRRRNRSLRSQRSIWGVP